MCAEVSDGDTEEAGDEVADGADGADNAGVVVRGVFADNAGFGVDAREGEIPRQALSRLRRHIYRFRLFPSRSSPA